MAPKGLNDAAVKLLRQMFEDFLSQEGTRATRQTVAPRVPMDPIRLVRACEDIAGGSMGTFRFISGEKGAEVDTEEDPVEMWSPPGVEWVGQEDHDPENDQGYALFIDSGWEVSRRSCPE